MVGLAFWRVEGAGCWTSIFTLGWTAKPPGAADEGRGFVVEEFFAGLLVDRGAAGDDDGGFALILDFDEFGVRDCDCFGGDGEGADFEVLLAVEEHHGGEVRHELGHAEGSGSVERWNDAEGGQHDEAVVVLVDEWQIAAFGAHAKVWLYCQCEITVKVDIDLLYKMTSLSS